MLGHAIDLAKNNRKVMIAQPSKLLIDQTERDLVSRNSGVPIKKLISGIDDGSSIVGRILDFISQTIPGQGEILLISQQALGRLPAGCRSGWDLFVDEVPNGFVKHEMNIAKSHRYITDHLSLGAVVVDKIVAVEAQDIGGLRALSANKTGDDAFKLFKLLADAILDDDRIVCVDADVYMDLVSGNGNRKSIEFLAFQKSEFVKGFASTTIMGANFDQTELAMIWQKMDSITWKPHPVITNNLRYHQHTNGARLTIKYVIDGNWSQYFGKMPLGNATILEGVRDAMAAELGQEFLWQANKKHGDYLFEYGEALPHITHGLNRHSFQKKHGVALLKAINHSSGPAAFLKAIGLTQEELKISLQYQNEYQAMMRCSLRDPLATDDVTVCVVSKGSALWLQSLFPNSKVEKLASDIPEPKPSGQPAARVRCSAEKQHDSREGKLVREAAARGEVYVPRQWKPKKPKSLLR